MKILRPAAALALLLGLTAATYQQNPSAPGPGAREAAPALAPSAERVSPEQTVAKIHAIDLMEVRAGTLALKKSKDSETIRYARLLVRDHRLADKKLASFAHREKLPVGSAAMEPDEAAAMARLERAAQGAEFDRVFADAMKQGHDKALSFLRSARAGASDFRLRSFIDKLLPLIEQHDALAGRLQARRLG